LGRRDIKGSSDLGFGRHFSKRCRIKRIYLFIQHLTRMIIARNRTVDQRQQLRTQRRQNEILAIAALFFRPRFNKATLEQQRLVIGSGLLQCVQVASVLAGRRSDPNCKSSS